MLKYYAHEDKVETRNKKDLKIAASAKILLDKETPSRDEDLLLELGMYRQKENVSDIKLGTKLNDSQSRHLQTLFRDHANVFSDVPARTSKKFKL